jgi:hypothetical protein
MWTVGVPLGLALLGFLAATSEGRERGGRAWSAALGVCFLCGVPGVVFASSALLGELMLAIACAWAGLVGLAMLRPGVQLGPAAALATLGYATVWILSLFYAGGRGRGGVGVAADGANAWRACPSGGARRDRRGPGRRRGGGVGVGILRRAGLNCLPGRRGRMRRGSF